MGFNLGDVGLVFLWTAIWGKIKRALDVESGDSALAYLQGQVAVEAIDQRGNGLLVIQNIEEIKQ